MQTCVKGKEKNCHCKIKAYAWKGSVFKADDLPREMEMDSATENTHWTRKTTRKEKQTFQIWEKCYLYGAEDPSFKLHPQCTEEQVYVTGVERVTNM